MDSKKQSRKRITLVLRVELIDRVLEKAKLLQQGPNNFVKPDRKQMVPIDLRSRRRISPIP
jgi:hypothetical protein